MRHIVLGLAALASACDGGSAGVDASSPPDTDGAQIVPGVDSGSPQPGTDAGPGTPSGWALRAHPCPGINRTDALMLDDDGSIWIGCGSGAEGRGLYVTRDDGASWSIPETSPSGVLAGFRVLSIHRGYGGLVYVAGEGPAATMAISLDTSSAPYAAEAVLTRGTVGRSFLASPS